jgi:hypothetical protein
MNINDILTYPLFGQTKMRTINGLEAPWLETVEITPFIKHDDGSFSGTLVYTLINMKTKDVIEKIEVVPINFAPAGDKK